jgi:hypothetical protein
MAAYTRVLLSGSTNGRGIKVVQTATAGTTIHTAVTGTTDQDNVWLWAQNNHTATVTLTLEWGNASTDDNIIVPIPAKSGLYLVTPGLPLQNELVIKAFASVANVVIMHGYADRLDY